MSFSPEQQQHKSPSSPFIDHSACFVMDVELRQGLNFSPKLVFHSINCYKCNNMSVLFESADVALKVTKLNLRVPEIFPMMAGLCAVSSERVVKVFIGVSRGHTRSCRLTQEGDHETHKQGGCCTLWQSNNVSFGLCTKFKGKLHTKNGLLFISDSSELSWMCEVKKDSFTVKHRQTLSGFYFYNSIS